MKKNNIFYACAAAALIFASCQKEGPAPVAPEADMNVITATSVNTKATTLDGVNMVWENGDVVKLFTRTWNESSNKYDAGWCDYTTTLNAPAVTASFVRDQANTNTVDNTSGKFFAIYRKGSEYIHQSRDYYAQFALDKELVAKNGGDFTSAIMYAASADSQFQFSHAVSYIKFTVDEKSTPFNKFIASPVNGSEKVISRIKITFAGEELVTEVLSGNSQDSYSVTLTTDDKQNFAKGTYYFAVNPNTYSQGLKFTFVNEAGQSVEKTTPANVVMKAGDVANLGTIGTLDFVAPEEPEEPETPSEPAPEAGFVYAENGKNIGVVFWIDPADHTKGKVISGTAGTNITWGTASATTYTWAKDIDTDDGMANHQYVLNLEGSNADTYPAVYFCKNLGDGWRLPTINEMVHLVKLYYGIEGEYDTTTTYATVEPYKSNAAKFDVELLKCGTDTKFSPISATWYWLGQTYYKDGDGNSGKSCRVKVGDAILVSGSNAKNKCYVRCVRDVELK